MDRTPPYVAHDTDAGFELVRTPHPVERTMRRAQRFIALCLAALGGLLVFAASRLGGIDVAIGAGFGLVLLGGAAAVLWWMRLAGVHRLEVTADRLVVHRAGFGGRAEAVAVDRSTLTGLRAIPVGQGRAARWRIEAMGPAGPITLAALVRRGSDRRGPELLAERLGLPLT